eukprot:scaffold176038_cov34-Attheya_sp.AAC.1
MNRPHPSHGGAREYPISERLRMLQMWHADLPVPASMVRSIKRWDDRMIPYRMAGNKGTRQMSGHHLLLLVMFKMGYPEASANQCIVFIGLHSEDGAVFSKKDISKALKGLDYTRKKASTIAKQAFTEENILKHYEFWHEDYLVGIIGTSRRRLIDVDECGFVIDDANKVYGHVVKGLRIRKPGNYGSDAVKLTVILAIEPGDPHLPDHVEGSIQNSRRWFRVSTDVGTTIEVYKDFLEVKMMDKFDENEPQRTVMHDNLNLHKDPGVVYAVHRRGHRVVCRPPYRPHDGPIEWAFDELACEMSVSWLSKSTTSFPHYQDLMISLPS